VTISRRPDTHLTSMSPRIAPSLRSDAKKDRRLSSFSIINAGFSLLKSLGKSAAKRKRDGNADEDPDDEDDSASKRTRGASGYAQGPGSGFITSSVRKSKGKSPSHQTRYDHSMFRIALQFHARTHSVQIAKRIVPNPLNVDRDPTPFPH
tara:strand:- start:229 stop:678 length:450 start_codon:yes stop_codon:yes gene_type:complete